MIDPPPNPSRKGRGVDSITNQSVLIMAAKKSYNGQMAYASPDRYGLLKEYARENRNNMTLGEKALWSSLRHKFLGYRFL